jgi:dCTP deaminase
VLERVTRIELALSAWEADVLPLNYTRGPLADRPQGGVSDRPDWHCPPIVPEPGRLPGVLLSDRDIKAEVESGRVRLDPFLPELIQPSSVDVRLDRFFRVFENHRYPHIDPAVEQADLTRMVETDGDDPFVLHPGEFVLGSTFEIISLPDDLAGRLEGKSSLGRLGLLTHSTAGWIDPGFSGHVTLELSNVATLPIKLWPGMKIGQLCLFRCSSPAEHPYGSSVYGSRYQDQRGPTPSKSYLNFYRSKV